MRSFLKNILRLVISNGISLASGVLVAFLIPKMMGLEDYADYKIFTLYVNYLSLLTLGLCDGLYLRFSGKKIEELNVGFFRKIIHIFYIQLLMFFLIVFFFSIFVLKDEYRLIGIALSIEIVSLNVVCLHQNLSFITSRFKEYSNRLIIKAVCTILYVLILFLLYRYCSKTISYIIYISGVVVIDLILAIWYIFSYKKFNFGKGCVDLDVKYSYFLIIGIPLLLSNMAGTIFLNLDRQFVSVLFSKEEYAYYAFAYNMLTLITTVTSSISIVIFPSMKKIVDLDVKSSLCKSLPMFSILVCGCVIVYFALYPFITFALAKYFKSLEIFRIILPGLILSSSVSVIFCNYYKLEKKIKLYFIITLSCILFSIGLNFVAYYIFKTYQAISWASLISLILWYILSYSYFIKKYKINFLKNVSYIILCIFSFYLFTLCVYWVACILYVAFYLIITIIFYGKLLKEYYINFRKNKEENTNYE